MEVKLIVIGGKNAGRVVPVSVERFLIGRAEECHLRPNSDLVSRNHCAISIRDGRVTLHDFGSRNGTLVNGQRVNGEAVLRAGDHLRVGPLEFEVAIEVNLAGQKKPKVSSLEEAAARTVESAAAKSSEQELDISSWVGDTVDGAADTKAMKTAESGTTAIHVPSPTEVQSAPESEQEKKSGLEKADEKKKPPLKSAGPAHGLKRPKSADSQSAAAETLRAFFNRK